MADNRAYIKFTGRLQSTSQEGILAEAQQIAISGSDDTNVKKYIDDNIASVKENIGAVAGAVYRPKGSLTPTQFMALGAAKVGDTYNITGEFTISGKKYPAYTNVTCIKNVMTAGTLTDEYWDALGGTVDLSPYAKTSEVNTIKGNLEQSISNNVSTLTTKVETAQTTANEAKEAATANASAITGVSSRVGKLEGVGAQANVIEEVKVNDKALRVSNKSVNIDLSSYAKSLELDIVSGDVSSIKKGLLLRFDSISTPIGAINLQSIKGSGNYGGFPSFDPKTKRFYISSGGQLYGGWEGFDDIPDAAVYSSVKLFIGKNYDGVFSKEDYAIYELKADGSLEKLELNSAKADALESQTQALEKRITTLEGLLNVTPVETVTALADEDGNILVDESGRVLTK